MKKTKGFQSIILNTGDDNKVALIRIVVGLIFLSECILKFLFLDLLGPGRFEKIRFSDPAFWAYFTASFDNICSPYNLNNANTL